MSSGVLCVEFVDQRLELGLGRHDLYRLHHLGSLAEQAPRRAMPAGETGRAVWPTIIMITTVANLAKKKQRGLE